MTTEHMFDYNKGDIIMGVVMVELKEMQKILPQLNGFFPITGEDGGNYTEFWLKGGQRCQSRSKTQTVLAQVARLYAKDLGLVKRQAAALLGYKKDLPLLITPQLVLIPVKVRTAKYKDEGTLGYAFFHSVQGVQPSKVGSYKACLIFCDGTNLFSLNTVARLRQKLNEAVDLIKEEEQRLSLLASPCAKKI